MIGSSGIFNERMGPEFMCPFQKKKKKKKNQICLRENVFQKLYSIFKSVNPSTFGFWISVQQV